MASCVYAAYSRPAKTAKRARVIWDQIVAEDGAPPLFLKLVIQEGGFRDWWFIRANGDPDEIEAGIVGWCCRKKST